MTLDEINNNPIIKNSLQKYFANWMAKWAIEKYGIKEAGKHFDEAKAALLAEGHKYCKA